MSAGCVGQATALLPAGGHKATCEHVGSLWVVWCEVAQARCRCSPHQHALLMCLLACVLTAVAFRLLMRETWSLRSSCGAACRLRG